jgi:hypothetical protein
MDNKKARAAYAGGLVNKKLMWEGYYALGCGMQAIIRKPLKLGLARAVLNASEIEFA